MLSIPPKLVTPPVLMLTSSPTRRQNPHSTLRHSPMLHDPMLTPTKPQPNRAAALSTSSSSINNTSSSSSSSTTLNMSPNPRTFSVLAEEPCSRSRILLPTQPPPSPLLLLPSSSSWIAIPRNRRQPVRRASSLRLLASGNGALANSNKVVRRSATTRSVLSRRDSVMTPPPPPPVNSQGHLRLSKELNPPPILNGLMSLAGKPVFVKPKLYLSPLQRMGGVVESPYFKYEVQLLHQLYFTSLVEEQVVRHVELLLSTSRPGAMHANLRAAFEWYQGHITRGISEMTELARRVRVFASYNIYFCKLMGWTDMWLEVSSHTNLTTAQVTKNYCYNPNGILPNYPPETRIHSSMDEHPQIIYSKDDTDIIMMDI